MSWIVQNIAAVLIVSGLLTCSMLLMAVAPRFAMRSTFGEIAEGPVANLIARSWGAMIPDCRRNRAWKPNEPFGKAAASNGGPLVTQPRCLKSGRIGRDRRRRRRGGSCSR